MNKIDALFYIISPTFFKPFIEYLTSFEIDRKAWDKSDILVLFNISKEELNKISTLLDKYVEVK